MVAPNIPECGLSGSRNIRLADMIAPTTADPRPHRHPRTKTLVLHHETFAGKWTSLHKLKKNVKRHSVYKFKEYILNLVLDSVLHYHGQKFFFYIHAWLEKNQQHGGQRYKTGVRSLFLFCLFIYSNTVWAKHLTKIKN